MSKVLVDLELLERIARDDEGAASLADFEELKRVLAQPAEAEGAIQRPASHPAECYALGTHVVHASLVHGIVRQADELNAALSAVTAERDGLAAARMAYANEFAPDENGDPDVGNVHANIRALKAERDRLRSKWARVESERDQLRAKVEMLREDAERWNYVRIQGDDMHWLNLLRVDLDDFGGNINAAVDALIDGEAPAMAAKEA